MMDFRLPRTLRDGTSGPERPYAKERFVHPDMYSLPEASVCVQNCCNLLL